jgi:hypothetical protein
LFIAFLPLKLGAERSPVRRRKRTQTHLSAPEVCRLVAALHASNLRAGTPVVEQEQRIINALTRQ